MTIRRRHVLAGMAAVSAFAVAPGIRAASAEAVTLRLNVIAYGEHAPFAVGIKKGFYEAQGIALELEQGKGSGNTVELVASKDDPFGYADAGTLMRAVSRGVPVEMVGVFQQLSPLSIIFFTDKGFKTPKDLEGHSIALTAGDSLSQLLPALFRKNGVDASKVRILYMDIAAKSTAVISGRADAMGGYFTTQAAQIATIAKKPTSWLKYSDFGVNTIAGGVLVNTAMTRQNPDLLRRFLRASVTAWSYAAEHPKEASAALVEAFPDSSFLARPGAALAQWLASRDLMHTARSQGKEPGWVAPADVQDTIDLLAQYAALSPKGKVDDYVTNGFMPG
jgi:NitT/TauT family transport system substrate-binding protein